MYRASCIILYYYQQIDNAIVQNKKKMKPKYLDFSTALVKTALDETALCEGLLWFNLLKPTGYVMHQQFNP